MSIVGLLTMVLIICLILAVCYVILIVVERMFGAIDPMIKSLVGLVVLILIILYVLQHVGVFALR